MTTNVRSQTAISRFAHVKVGIVIKALNEASKIRHAIESALAATCGLTSIVVLADSGSTDGTVELALDYDIRVVQLADPREKCCGIGAQLGFQHLDCDYVYILDGDMVLFADFIPAAVELMEADPTLDGVAGLVEEHGEGNYEFERRKALNDGLIIGDTKSLDMGGLYRTAAVRRAGYLTNRNLHSYEEKELGLRLLVAGSRLRRIDMHAVQHFGKLQSTGSLILGRWRTRHLDGPGELMRSALGQPYMGHTLLMFYRLILVLLSYLLFSVTLLLSPWAPWLLGLPVGFHLCVFLNFLRRDRSLTKAGIAYANLNVLAAAFLRGMLRDQKSPFEPVGSVLLR
jgi:glycosyltransferase involved in cell wall biosynthesis